MQTATVYTSIVKFRDYERTREGFGVVVKEERYIQCRDPKRFFLPSRGRNRGLLDRVKAWTP